jgi:hypothetical protein
LHGYTAAVRAVLQIKGQAPFTLAGLEIYETLARIETSLARCWQAYPHPLLEQLRTLTQRRQRWALRYQRLRRQQDWILGLAEILDVPRTRQGWWTQAGVEVAQAVDQFLAGLAALQPYYPEDAAVIDHIIQRTADWAPGLFHCYEEPAIPRTDNGLEQYIGLLKRQRRRITGRKKVADYIIRHGPYAVFYDPAEPPAETLARFRQVSATEFQREWAGFQSAQTGQRQIRSFRRDPDRYLQRLEHLWPGSDDP